MNRILSCDWLPEQVRWSYLARSRLTTVPRKKHLPEGHIINPLLTKLVRSRWLDIGVSFCEFLDLNSVSINYCASRKNTLATMQQSSSHAWSDNKHILLCGDWLSTRLDRSLELKFIQVCNPDKKYLIYSTAKAETKEFENNRTILCTGDMQSYRLVSDRG